MVTPLASEEMKRLVEQNRRLRLTLQGGHDRVLDKSNGLVHCNRCGARAGDMPKECPGSLMTLREQVKVGAGQLDYFNGKWWIPG